MKHPNKEDLIIYTDGACSGNPGVGGYGAILQYGQIEKEISGCSEDTTNNRMEMIAVIEALTLLKRPSKVKVVSDSQYVINGITKWIDGWRRRNWITSQKKPVLNKDLWKKILDLSQTHQIEWEWVRGHKGHKENERCDELAREALKLCQR